MHQPDDFAVLLVWPLGTKHPFYGGIDGFIVTCRQKTGTRRSIQRMGITRSLIENGTAVRPLMNEKALPYLHPASSTIKHLYPTIPLVFK